MSDWAMLLYQRYVQLYGDPIERPIPDDAGKAPAEDAPPVTARPRSQC